MPQKPTPAQQLVRSTMSLQAIFAVAAAVTNPDSLEAKRAAHCLVDQFVRDDLSHYYFRLMLIKVMWWAGRRIRTDAQAVEMLSIVGAPGDSRWRKAVVAALSKPNLPEFVTDVTHAPADDYPTGALMDACIAVVTLVTAGQDTVRRWRDLATFATDAMTHHVDPRPPGTVEDTPRDDRPA